MQQRVLVEQEQFAPHAIVDAGDTSQIAERVSGIVLEFFIVIAGHQAHRDAVRQLRYEADQLVVFLRRYFGNSREAEQLSDLPAQFLCVFGVLFGRHHNIVRLIKDRLITVFDPQTFAACHRVRGNKFTVLTQKILNLAHKAAFDARHVGDDRAALKKPLFFAHPLQEG